MQRKCDVDRSDYCCICYVSFVQVCLGDVSVLVTIFAIQEGKWQYRVRMSLSFVVMLAVCLRNSIIYGCWCGTRANGAVVVLRLLLWQPMTDADDAHLRSVQRLLRGQKWKPQLMFSRVTHVFHARFCFFAVDM